MGEPLTATQVHGQLRLAEELERIIQAALIPTERIQGGRQRRAIQRQLNAARLSVKALHAYWEARLVMVPGYPVLSDDTDYQRH